MNDARQALPIDWRSVSDIKQPSSWSVGDVSTVVTAIAAVAIWLWRNALKELFLWGWNAFKAPGRIMEFARKLDDLQTEVYVGSQTCNVMLQTIAKPIFKSTADGKCTFANTYMLRRLGRQFSDIQGDNWKQIVSAADWTRVVNGWADAVKEKRDFSMEYDWVHANGKDLIHVHVTTSRLFDLKGNLVGYIAFCEDEKWPRRDIEE